MTSIQQSARGRTGTFLLLAAGTFAVGTGGFVVAGILPGISASLDVSISTASLLIASYAILFALGCPVIAILAGRMNRTRLMVGGLLVYSLGNAAATLLPTFELVIVGRLVSAVGAAAFIPTATAAAAAIAAPEHRGRAIAIVTGGFTAATALGAPLGTAIGAALSWHASLWFVVIIAFIAAVGLAAVLRSVPMARAVSVRERLAPLVRANIVTPLVTILLLIGAQYSAYTFFSAVHDRATGGDGTILAVLLFVYGTFATVGNLIAGSLCDRFGNRIVVNVFMLLLIASFAVMPFISDSLWGAGIAIAVWGLASSAALLGLQHRVVQASRAGIAWVSSAIFFGVAASGSLGTFAIAAVGAHYLTEVALIVLIVVAAFGEISLALVLRHQGKRTRASATGERDAVRAEDVAAA